MASARSYVKFFESLAEGRHNFDRIADECRHYFLPNRPSFIGATKDGLNGYDDLYTAAPALSAKQLTTAVGHSLRPGDRNWIRPVPRNPKLANDTESLDWCSTASNVAYSLIYDPRARMEEKASEVDGDAVVFGQGILYQNYDPARGHIIYRSRPMAHSYMMEGVTGAINQVHSFYMMGIREIVEHFGAEALSDKQRDIWRQESGRDRTESKKYKIIHGVMPIEVAARFGFEVNKRYPYHSIWVDYEEQRVIRDGGYYEFPFATPRWDTASGETMAYSPAMIALADAKTANAVARTLLEVGEIAARPPLVAAFEMIKGDIELFPGGVTYIDGQGLQYQQGRPIQPIDTGHNIPLNLEILQAIETRIRETFMLTMLALPQSRDMTVDELRARTEELVRFTGPIMQRLDSDYNTPMVMYALTTAQRHGFLPPMPQQLQESGGIEVICEGPLRMARQRASAYRAIEAMNAVLPIAKLNGEAMQVVDWDRLTSLVFTGIVDDHSLIRAPDVVEQERAATRQAQEAQALAASAKDAGAAAKDFASADKETGGLVQQLLGGMTGAG